MSIDETVEKYLDESTPLASDISNIVKILLGKLKRTADQKGYSDPIKKKGDDGEPEYYFEDKKGKEFVMFSVYIDDNDIEPWVQWGRGDIKKNGKYSVTGSGNDPYDSNTLKNIERLF